MITNEVKSVYTVIDMGSDTRRTFRTREAVVQFMKKKYPLEKQKKFDKSKEHTDFIEDTESIPVGFISFYSSNPVVLVMHNKVE